MSETKLHGLHHLLGLQAHKAFKEKSDHKVKLVLLVRKAKLALKDHKARLVLKDQLEKLGHKVPLEQDSQYLDLWQTPANFQYLVLQATGT